MGDLNLGRVATVLGIIGGLIALFTVIVDWKVSELEKRMNEKYVLLREINRLEDRIDEYHVHTGPLGRPTAKQ